MSETSYVEAIGYGYELAREEFEREYGRYPDEDSEDDTELVDEIYEYLCDKYRY